MRSGIAEGSDSENDNDISDYNVTMRMIILPLDDRMTMRWMLTWTLSCDNKDGTRKNPPEAFDADTVTMREMTDPLQLLFLLDLIQSKIVKVIGKVKVVDP